MSRLLILILFLMTGGIAYAGFLNAISSTEDKIIGAKTFDPLTKTAGVTLSNGDLTFTVNPNGTAYSADSKYLGSFQIQWTVVNKVDDNLVFGLGTNHLTGGAPGMGNDGVGCFADGSCYNNSLSNQASLGTFVNGDIGTMAVNLNKKLVWFRRNNGSWNANTNADPDNDKGGFSFSPLMNGQLYFSAFATQKGASLTVNPKPTNTGLANFQNW